MYGAGVINMSTAGHWIPAVAGMTGVREGGEKATPMTMMLKFQCFL